MRRAAPIFALGGLVVALFLLVGMSWLGTLPSRVLARADAPNGLLTETPTALPTLTTTPSAGGTATATPTTPPAATATPTVCLIYFVDVPPDSTFYTYVRCLGCRGIVGGYPCGGPGEPCPGAYYRPGNNVTRGQTSKIVAAVGGLHRRRCRARSRPSRMCRRQHLLAVDRAAGRAGASSAATPAAGRASRASPRPTAPTSAPTTT